VNSIIFRKFSKPPWTCSRPGRTAAGDGAWDPTSSSLGLSLPPLAPLLREGQMWLEGKLGEEGASFRGWEPCGQRSGSTLTDGHDHCQQQEGLHAEGSVGRNADRPA